MGFFFQIVAAFLVASSSALPIEDTPEVKAAKAQFQAAFSAAEQGLHSHLAPQANYLADEPDVAAAKARFAQVFQATEARDEYNAKVAAYKEMLYRHHFAYNGLYNGGAYGHPGYGYGLHDYHYRQPWNYGAWTHPQAHGYYPHHPYYL